MNFLGITGMQYSGVPFHDTRILLAEDSNVFTQMIGARLKELLGLTVEVCRNFEELQECYEHSSEEVTLAISNINLPGAENGEALEYLVDLSIPTIVFTSTFHEDTREKLITKEVVDYILKDNVFAVDMLTESVCRFLTNHRHHVLIVDDSPTARALLSSRLKRYNFRVSLADSGAKALEILRNNPDIGLVVTDYNMPDIDGFELTRRIRTMRGSHELRIIGVSSSTNRLLSARFLKAGGNDFMLRPFIEEEFYCRVNQNLDTLVQIKTARGNGQKAAAA
ncbi:MULTISPECIES: response regulator [Rhizobium/Agrobacterium group]|jgi:PleD family two-component response regulator|uniref:Response regulator n=2 Tax=Rhizobium/Agrobacterium group TaxID=227290 RepID=A0AA92C1K4_RHIRH|nr:MULTISPECIES: response regulator [Rhizobium/Agrobacterium group]KQM34993.1 two-component system response regulator [Rhizobium sp. Leaf202]KQN87726.1 two-component system response regulator [Rhizobium sp. Leaf68]KQZ97066.1 two-component system response regulator [Rhizobium sp. Root564]MDP9570640.1 PleD family two-component response regulator [Agrobacterium larrymoorei]MQB20682.1 response regulator [Agrobacterium tumefaciens]PVE73830.1 response regulator [Sphingomonas sp. TPD3009]